MGFKSKFKLILKTKILSSKTLFKGCLLNQIGDRTGGITGDGKRGEDHLLPKVEDEEEDDDDDDDDDDEEEEEEEEDLAQIIYRF